MSERNASIFLIFSRLFGFEVVKSIVGEDPVMQRDFFRYLSLRMIVHGLPVASSKDKNKERTAYFGAVDKLKDVVPAHEMWGCHKYFAMRDGFSISEKVISGPISESWASMIRVGESVAFDEKQRTWRGKSKFIHMNRAKPEPIGHMICMLTTQLEGSKIPFTLGLYEYLTNASLGCHISAETLMEWATGLVDRMQFIGQKPVIVNDSLYTTNASKGVFFKNSQPFISAQKPSWWTAMESMLQPKVSQPGDTAYAWNSKTGTVVCCHFDSSRGGKRKYVVSTAFTHHSSPDYAKINPPVYSEYAATFNACDTFNMHLSKNWYPYRSGHWEKHFESMFLSIAFMNFYSICLHLRAVDESVSFKEFLVQAGTLLGGRFFNE